MTHQRQVIREAVKAALLDKTAAGSRVFSTREVAWRRQELPGIAVYSLEEESDAGKRALQLEVAIIESLSEGVDDSLDSLSAEVEAALRSDPSLGGAVVGLRYTGMQAGVIEDQGRQVGAMRTFWTALYIG